MKNIKKQKGFTLIELLIVMAIFGIIMLGVMKIADPLARVMNKSSTKEKSAAYVDNITDYLDSSMRYAKYMKVYKGEFTEYRTMSETEIVKEFINDYYDGCIDSTNHLMKGDLHVMKLFSQGTYTNSAGSTVQLTVDDGAGTTHNVNDGEIWETIYSFTCGDSYIDDASIRQWNEEPVVNLTTSRMVINPEHLRDYSYYYKYGYSTFESVDHTSDRDTFFALHDSTTDLGSKGIALSVVAYPKDNKEIQADGTAWFKAPCYMNTLSLYLINLDKLTGAGSITDIRQVQDDTGYAAPVDGEIPVEKVTPMDTPFRQYPLVSGTAEYSDNIYFVYVLPSELYK